MDCLITPATFILFFLISTYGFGVTSARFFYKDEKTGAAFAASLGIAILITFGGLLNLLHIAYPAVLSSALVLGVILAMIHLSLRIQSCIKSGARISRFLDKYRNADTRLLALEDSILLLLPLAPLAFCTYFLMPTYAFNFHDDLHTYMDWPLQMLQTGSFQHNLFSQLGLHYLGGQSFMQSFSQIYFDIRYINVFDAIICFVLGIGIIVEFGKKIESGFSPVLLAVILYLFINPMYVNISALYSASLMILGLVFSTCRLREAYANSNLSEKETILPATIPVSLFFTSLVTLKATFVVFPILYFLLCFTWDAIRLKNKKLMLTINLGTAFTAMILLTPWLAISFKKYASIFQHLFTAQQQTGMTSAAKMPLLLDLKRVWGVLSTADIFWGNSFPDYLLILTSLGLFSLACSFWLARRHENMLYHMTMPVMAAAGACFLSFFFLSYGRPDLYIRYSIPIMIAVLPLMTLFAGHCTTNRMTKQRSIPTTKMLTRVMSFLLALQLITAGTFLGTFIDRVERIADKGMMLSFPVNEYYFSFMKSALSREREEIIRKAQDLTEEGTEILAWISTPFNLDFSRNNISLIKVLEMPWSDIPIGADRDELLRYFRGKGIRYIIWEYEGYAVVSSKFCQDYKKLDFLYLIDAFRDIAAKTNVIYHQNFIVIFDIEEYTEALR